MPQDLEVSDIFYRSLFDANNQGVEDNQKTINNAFNKQFSYQTDIYNLRGYRFDNTSNTHILEVDFVTADTPPDVNVEPQKNSSEPPKRGESTGGGGRKKRGKSKKKKTKRKQKRKSKKRKSRKRSKTKRR